MSAIERAREQAIAYEQGTVEAEFELQEFKAASDEDLAAIRSEFEDYKKHPLWQEYDDKQAAAINPAEAYRRWSSENVDKLGWRELVLYTNRRYGYISVDPYDPDRSTIPASVEEFDRRITIASHIGEVAAMLEAHRGQPIVSLASYEGNLALKTADQHKKYTFGQVGPLPKTRAIVGTIDQPDTDPILTNQSASATEEDTRPGPRLTLAGSVAGSVSAYSLPDSKRQLKQQTSPPFYTYYKSWAGKYKSKDLPVGNSVIGDFPLDRLRGHDLVVIDGPHRTAADHEFSDDIVLHRPKQRIETGGQSRDQEVAVAPGQNTEVYEATVISEDQEVTLPSLRHDTIWLVGSKAIEANLADVVFSVTDPIAQKRGTSQAIVMAAHDLVKLAGRGRPARELAA